MFESAVGFSVSFTRQCCGIGSGGGGGAPPARAPRPRPAAAPAGGPAGAAPGGGGGGTNTPAGTTSADITIVCGVERLRRLSHEDDVFAARSRASAIIRFLVPGSGFQVRVLSSKFHVSVRRSGGGSLRRILRPRGDVSADRNQIFRCEIRDDELHQLGL